MAFRGFGDDALKVKADKREAALKAAQIAASERASMRSAGVHMAGIQENARQADMANQRAGEQLAAGNERFAAQLEAGEAARMDELALEREGMAADEAYRRDSLAADEAARKDDLSVKIAEMSQKERQLQLNESTAAKLDAEWKQQQAAQEEWSSEVTAIELAILRFTVENPDKKVPMVYINAWNNANGVAYGDPGSLTQAFGVPDPQTGARLGSGTVKIGWDGKPIQSILDPATILPQLRKSMAPDKWEDFAQRLIGANKAKGSDRVTAATIREMQKAKLEFAKSDPASLVKMLAEQEDSLRVTKPAKTGAGKAADPANQENLDRVRRIKTNVLKEMERQTAGEEEAAPAPTLSPEQKKFMELPGGGAAPSSDTSVVVEKDKLVVTINGQTARMPDTPKNRATLRQKHGIQIGGETRSAPAKTTTEEVKLGLPKGEFDTALTPEEEKEFTAWKQKYAPRDSGEDYDYRGAFKAGEKPGKDGHWTDKFKKPNHPTFSDQSQYATGENKDKAGTWKGEQYIPPTSEPKATDKGGNWKTPALGKPLIETDMNAQKSGNNKLPPAVSAQFSKQQEESLTDEDKKAILEIHAASWGQKDPKTGLPIDPKEYSKQKIREYFKQKKKKYDADFNRLFGKFLK